MTSSRFFFSKGLHGLFGFKCPAKERDSELQGWTNARQLGASYALCERVAGQSCMHAKPV